MFVTVVFSEQMGFICLLAITFICGINSSLTIEGKE